MKESGKARAITAHRVGQVPDRVLSKVAAEHGSDPLKLHGDLGSLRDRNHPLLQLTPHSLQSIPGIGGLQGIQRSQAGRHRQWVSAQGARLINRTQGR